MGMKTSKKCEQLHVYIDIKLGSETKLSKLIWEEEGKINLGRRRRCGAPGMGDAPDPPPQSQKILYESLDKWQ